MQKYIYDAHNVIDDMLNVKRISSKFYIITPLLCTALLLYLVACSSWLVAGDTKPTRSRASPVRKCLP